MPNPIRVYVASSWRNPIQPAVVDALRNAGFNPYDFRKENGFGWHQIDPAWESWTPDQYLAALSHPFAKAGFERDMAALKLADALVVVMPCGFSAGIEFGHAVAAGKPAVVLVTPGSRPDLMIGMSAAICTDLEGVVEALRSAFVPTRPSTNAHMTYEEALRRLEEAVRPGNRRFVVEAEAIGVAIEALKAGKNYTGRRVSDPPMPPG